MTVFDIVRVRLCINSFSKENAESTSDTGILETCQVTTSGFVLCSAISVTSVTITQFGKFTKLCFDDQRSEHYFVADHSDTNLIDAANNATSVKRN